MENELELTAYEKLVRLALMGLLGFSALTLICVLPWRGLLFATANPVEMGIEPNQLYLGLRVGLRLFPWIAGIGLVLGWGLYLFRVYKTAFYVALVALGMYAIVFLSVILFALMI